MVEVRNLVRRNILDLRPYSSARDEFVDQDAILLDANENPFGEMNTVGDLIDALNDLIKK